MRCFLVTKRVVKTQPLHGELPWFDVIQPNISMNQFNAPQMSLNLVMLHFYLRPSSSKNTSVRPSVRPSICVSVRPSVCHTFFTMFPSFTNDRSDVHAKVQGHRSKVKAPEVKTQSSLFQTVTFVWIHIWLWNDAQSSIEEVTYCFSKSNFMVTWDKKIADFDPNWAFQECNSSLNLPMATEWCTKLEVGWERCPIVFFRSSVKLQGHTAKKIVDFDLN